MSYHEWTYFKMRALLTRPSDAACRAWSMRCASTSPTPSASPCPTSSSTRSRQPTTAKPRSRPTDTAKRTVRWLHQCSRRREHAQHAITNSFERASPLNLLVYVPPQAELIVDADQHSLLDPDGGCQRCTTAFLARAARGGSAVAPTTALAGVTCRRLGRTRTAISVATSGALLILAALLSVRLSAAFIPLAGTALRHSRGLRPDPLIAQPPTRSAPPAAAAARPFGCGPRGRAAGASAGPAMCNPVATPVDPAVAAMLLSVCLSRAGQGLERLGLLAPAQARAEGEGRQSEHAAAAAPQGPASLSLLRRAAARPAAAARALRRDGGRGTATMARVAAAETVLPRPRCPVSR